jgi:pimeloyl-ACP methyl ester carboxylesterase
MSTSLRAGGGASSAENFIGCAGQRQKANARRGVLISGGIAQTALSNIPPDRITNALTDDSIPVGYADYAGGSTWGNDTGRTRVGQAWTDLQAFGAKADKVCLYGASGGCFPLLRWAVANVSSVACFAGIIPGLSLVDAHDNNRGGFAASIETAHGISGTYAGNGTITARDPLQNAAAFTFPILLFYSANDPVAVPSVVAAFAAAAPNVTLVNMGNLGHAASADFQYSDQIVAFLAKYA